MSTKGTLEEQGLTVSMGPGPNNTMSYYITDPGDGRQYILTYDEVDDLQNRRRLTLAGIKEHDEKIRNQAGA